MSADKKLTAAAETLLTGLASESTQQVLRETALQLGIPLWMLLTGLLQKCYDSGEHTAPVLDPQWTMGNPTERPTLGPVKCKQCHREYTPRWIGQEYCDAKCGSAAAQSLANRARVEQPLVRYPVGQEPAGVAKSTITESEAHGTGRSDSADEVGAPVAELGGQSPGEDPIAAIERQARATLSQELA